MRAADVLLLALVAGAGGVIGALVRGYAAAGRVDASSTACAERPPGTQYATGGIVRSPGVPFGEDGCTLHEWVGPPPVRHMTYIGGPNRRGPGRPPPAVPDRTTGRAACQCRYGMPDGWGHECDDWHMP